MNILQQELNSINDKLEILNYRKWQLDSIIDEYNDTLERIKSLVENMNDVNVDPSNLMMEIEKIVYDFEPDEPEEIEQEQEETTPDNHEKINSYIIPYDPTLHGELCMGTDDTQDDDIDTQTPDTVDDSEIVEASPGATETQPTEHFKFDLRLFPQPKPETEQEPEPVRLMMMIPMASPEPTPEPIEFIEDGVEDEEYLAHIRNHPKPPAAKCEPESEQITATPIQLNTRAWRRGDTLLIGFSNKRLLNAWMKWIKNSWGDRVAMDTYERLSGFPHCLAVLWFGNGKFVDWQRLASIDYSIKPDDQRF